MDMVNKVSLQDYLNDFIPSLENFCSKSPLQPNVSVITETGKITLSSTYMKDSISFTVDPMVDKKKQIKDVKMQIEKLYPIIFDHKKFPLSAEEIEDVVSSGAPIKEALSLRKDVYLPRYKILRVHNKYNEIDAFDFKTKKTIKFKVRIPLVPFMSKIFTLNRESMSDQFRQDVKFLYAIKK